MLQILRKRGGRVNHPVRVFFGYRYEAPISTAVSASYEKIRPDAANGALRKWTIQGKERSRSEDALAAANGLVCEVGE